MTHGASSPTIPRIGLVSPTNGPSTPYMVSNASILGRSENSSSSLSRLVNPRLAAVSTIAVKRVTFLMVVLSSPWVDATDVRPGIGPRQTVGRSFHAIPNRDRCGGGLEDRAGSSLAQQLESVCPVIAQKAGDAPEDAQRLDRAGRLDLPHVGRLPAELLEDSGHRLLRPFVIAAYEHGGPAPLELRVDHEGGAHGIEGLDEFRARELALQPLYQRLVETGEDSQHAVHGGRIGDGIRRIDDRFARQARGARRAQGLRARRALDRQDHQTAETCRVPEAADLSFRVLPRPLLQLRRLARPHHDLVTMLQESARQRLRHVARSEHSDFHGALLREM